MSDIVQDLPIKAAPEQVFQAVSSPTGLVQWWALSATGVTEAGAPLDLSFGPGYDWQARITCYQPSDVFELEMTRADADWIGTRVRFEVERRDTHAWLRFRHSGWPRENEHYRTSCHCWALYLRVLRRFLEHGETVAYDDRLGV